MPGTRFGRGRFQHQVKVGFHQTIGMDLPVGLGASLGQSLQKGSPVNVVAEDGGFAIAAAHDVINGAPILDPQFSGHEEVLPALCKVSISYYQGPTPKMRKIDPPENRPALPPQCPRGKKPILLIGAWRAGESPLAIARSAP